ncbi:hypothetical protein ACO2Q1_13410 [Brevundimonas sp. VNH65]|uniref:hypothetical protein n=1 Tax=Brevundimonas sp. VNH65 TaxID=3400917 RepID=UPI003C04CC4A
MMPNAAVLDQHFSRYSDHDPLVPIWRVSRAGHPAIHRFYDTWPISPSGRYLALTEFARDDILPEPGDTAEVVVRDLENGDVVYRSATRAWDTQLGAQVQWGATDRQLLFNDMSISDWNPFGVVADISSSSTRRLDRPIYMVSPSGRLAASPCLKRIFDVQPGYGVITPKAHRAAIAYAPDDDGIYITDIETGRSTLWLSISEMIARLPDALQTPARLGGRFFVFHTKWSPGERDLMIVLRCRMPGAKRTLNWLVVADLEKSDIRIAVSPSTWSGGHHPNWYPDGSRILMNLTTPFRRTRLRNLASTLKRGAGKIGLKLSISPYTLRLVSFRPDGSDLTTISDHVLGSGHPTWHGASRAVLTDAYPYEDVAFGDGTVPLRWTPEGAETSECLIRIHTTPRFEGPRREWRVDPHPAWSPDQRWFVFNGCPDGERGVFLADMSGFLDNTPGGPA